jgi:hypothetical protein
VVLSLSLGTLGSGTVSAAWSLIDDFSRPNSTSVGGGWFESEWDGSGSLDLSGNQPRLEIDNNTLKLTNPVYTGSPSAGFTSLGEGIANGTTGTLFFQLTATDANAQVHNMQFGLSDLAVPSATGGDDFSTALALYGSAPNLLLHSGGWFTVAQYDSGTLYNHWLVANNDTDTWDLYRRSASGDATPADLLGSSMAFRADFDLPLITFIVSLFGENTGNDQVNIDNIYLDASGQNLNVPWMPSPTTFEWQKDGLGNWKEPGNWTPGGGPPNDNEETAIFGGLISGLTTVVTNEPQTVNLIQFDSTIGYAVAGAGNVNLEANGEGDLPGIDVAQGRHEFQVRVNLNSNTDVKVAAGATLEFDNRLNLMGNTLTKTGAGEIQFNSNVITGNGRVECQEGACSGSGTISGDYNQTSGGTLAIEIGGTQAEVDSDVLNILGDASLAGTLSVELIDGFTPGGGDTFKVLTASGELTDLGLTLGGPDAGAFTMSIDTTNDWITLMTAGAGLPGDYNGNGTVDAADYTIFRDNLGGNSSALGGNGSGAATVVQADYDLWKQNFAPSGAGSSAAVPEPCSLLLLAMGLSGVAFVVLRRG